MFMICRLVEDSRWRKMDGWMSELGVADVASAGSKIKVISHFRHITG
jgi:hypothetical protein